MGDERASGAGNPGKGGRGRAPLAGFVAAGAILGLVLVAYVNSLSEGRRMETSRTGTGPRNPVALRRDGASSTKAELVDGEKAYASMCAACHGAKGEGGGGPAVWGPNAWSATSDMAKPGRLAAYIQKAMAVYAGTITDEQARDIAAFIDAQPRPGRDAR